jgi:hypothetical protein
MKFRLLLFLLLFSTCYSIVAQYYDTGQDPASIKWMQIKTDRFRIIYPESYGDEGLKFAKSLDDSYSKLGSLFPARKVKIPVIIHNYTTFSNGYVAWAPKRMEIYPTPEQNGIPLDPMEQLTTHELTHVLQMVSLNKGFTRALSVLAGEQVTGAVSAILPSWFMEGDAVFAESLLSLSGRGKTPSFQKQLKAITLENPQMYSYDLMIAESFNKFTPDHYQYGYQMVAWSYAKYGPKLWNKVLDFTAKYPFTAVPVNLSLNKNAGITKSKLYSETFDSLRTIWKQEELRIKPVSYEPLNRPKKRDYINYYSPVVVGQDSVIAIKTSFSAPPEFVLVNTKGKTEKRIHMPGNIYPFTLSGSAHKLVWVETQPDPRWENRTFSVIKIMDLQRNLTRQLSFKSRYLAAAISHDGRFIAAVENTISNENSLQIIDAFNGDILNKILVPGNAYPQKPQWSFEGTDISLIFLSSGGEGVMSYSLAGQNWNTLIEPGRYDLQSAFLRNDSLFFVSSSSGTDNIYVQTPGKKVSKLTNARYGAYDPYATGGNVIFSDYSSSGYNISMTNISDTLQNPAIKPQNSSFLINRFDTIKINETDRLTSQYIPEPYRKAGHLFGIHSWMPFYADIEKIQADPTSVRPGATIMSQNQLSTVISSIGYEYASDKTHQIHTKVSLKGWLTVLESQIDYGANANIAKLGASVGDPITVQPGLKFTNTLLVPLSFSTGRFSQFLQPSLSSEYSNDYIWTGTTFDYGQTILTGRIYFGNFHRAAFRDIYPKWAQVIDISHSSAPFDNKLYGTRSLIKTALYFPGLIRNHGIRFRYESETQDPQKLLFFNKVSLPRSYRNVIPEKINFISADYVMPLMYPDLNFPGILFLRRIRTSAFYDYARGSKNHYLNPRSFRNYTETFKSFGGDIMADFYLLRIPFMVSAGVQSTWKSINRTPEIEFVFNIDIMGNKIGKSRLY